MQPNKLRVIVEYEGQPRLIKLRTELKGQDLFRKILKKIDLDINQWESYDLILKSFECNVTRTKDLVQDDILVLKLKASRSIVSDLQEESCFENSFLNENREQDLEDENNKSNSEESLTSNTSLDNWLEGDVSYVSEGVKEIKSEDEGESEKEDERERRNFN